MSSSSIDGIGGVFLMSEDPEALARWYGEHLGLRFSGGAEFGAWYLTFSARDPVDTRRRVDTVFSIMRAKVPLPRASTTTLPESVYGDRRAMINLRVRELEPLVAELTRKGVAILKREDESYGRFAWIHDADGNRLELYEPISGGPAATQPRPNEDSGPEPGTR
jgi:catechol 2,3-dioxygenase-like lactoylglutathione lyase family enzyme